MIDGMLFVQGQREGESPFSFTTTTHGGLQGSYTDGERRSSSTSGTMHDNCHLSSSSSSSPRVPGDALEEAMLQISIQTLDTLEEIGFYSGPYPERPDEQDCAYYMRTGLCGYGRHCHFNHPPNVKLDVQYMSELPERFGQPECKYFMKTGACKYGATCKYHHPHDRDGPRVQLNYLGLPMRQGEKECPYYTRTGSCKFGATCKFHHSEPTALLPDSGSPLYAAAELPLSPASGSPYPAGLTSWFLQGAPYVSGPHLQGSPTYMPVILSPQQSTPSVQPGWNTCHGPTSPLSSPEGKQQLGAGTVYSSAYMTDSSSSSHMHGVLSSPVQGSSTAMEHPGVQCQVAAPQREAFPKRLDQPQCQRYMKTGCCKYGTTCRYHHPQERVALSPCCMLSSQGLPLRPGQPTCPFYSRYGICKFGPICKFDHPLTGPNCNPAAFSSSEQQTTSYPEGGSSGAHCQSTSEEFSEQDLKATDQYSKAEEASSLKQKSTEEGAGDRLAANSPSTSGAAI